MKFLFSLLRIICVAVGLTAVMLDVGPDLGRRAIFLGICVGFVTWLFDARKHGWVDHMVRELGLVRFRRVFSVCVLFVLGIGAIITLNQNVKSQSEALFLYVGAVLVSGLALHGFLIFLRLKQLERQARGR